MKQTREEKALSKLCISICNDHYELTKSYPETTVSYMFHLYSTGNYAGMYKPYMFIVELKLCKFLGLISDEEYNNIVAMIESPDKENLYMVSQIVKFYMKDRHKKFGAIMSSQGYEKARKEYSDTVIDFKDFVKYR
jgi:hypothetical protein